MMIEWTYAALLMAQTFFSTGDFQENYSVTFVAPPANSQNVLQGGGLGDQNTPMGGMW